MRARIVLSILPVGSSFMASAWHEINSLAEADRIMHTVIDSLPDLQYMMFPNRIIVPGDVVRQSGIIQIEVEEE